MSRDECSCTRPTTYLIVKFPPSWNLSAVNLVKHHLLDSPTKPDYATKHCKGKLHYDVETSNFCFCFMNSLIALYLQQELRQNRTPLKVLQNVWSSGANVSSRCQIYRERSPRLGRQGTRIKSRTSLTWPYCQPNSHTYSSAGIYCHRPCFRARLRACEDTLRAQCQSVPCRSLRAEGHEGHIVH
jgi:hypothetical protein